MERLDAYTFIRMMEERKLDLIESVKDLEERDIVGKIVKEVEEFRRRKNNRIYIYYGLRGTGKTTAMIQALSKTEAGYIDGSVLAYYNLDLLDVIKEYTKTGKKDVIFIDELTDIPRWGEALKIAYDSKKIKLVCTGSSAIKIATEKNRISRRAIFEEIPPLTFREFLRIFENTKVRKVNEDFLLAKPADAYIKAKAESVDLPNLSKELRGYMQSGFPLYYEMQDMERVSSQVLSGIITKDMPGINGFNLGLVDTMERIVYTLVSSPPGTTSISKLAEIGDCSKTTASNIVKSLEVSSLLIGVPPQKTGASRFRKEKKYLFSSPAIRYGFLKMLVGEERNIGGLREDTFVSTLHYLGYRISFPQGMKKVPDYVIEKGGKRQVVEVGGPGKSSKQLAGGIIVTDGDRLDYKGGVTWIPLYLVALAA